jgi:predicted Mrr-cat superfamily restriction endonuclease
MKASAWIFRPYPDSESNYIELFKENEYIGIGWTNTGDLTGKSREDIKRAVAASLGVEGVRLGIIYSTLDLITNRLSTGDLLLVPDGREIFFARVESDYYYEKDHIAAHRRRIHWFKTSILRESLPSHIRKALRSNRLIADISNYTPEIETLASGKQLNTSILNKNIHVSYPLRYDFEVSFELPSNMTKSEAARLSNFLSTLYFEDSSKKGEA